jgi:hypothetical protein
VTEYKHQQVGIGFPVYCTDRDAVANIMLLWALTQYAEREMIFGCLYSPVRFRRPQYSTDPAELRWMADIAAGDDVWGA